ncbi:hypothetical protein [Lutibacter sp. B1]|uniref:hypothetical protein n=1 Tax=Lutibacter sp. B1 TaxID=2725996 RepID=UPI001456579A|nr:hypothetical protein [Lutibacter sp. B1]NLP58077.1 hypothetical protein [Lutibacter sp. B1]
MKNNRNILLIIFLVFCVLSFKINAQQTDENTYIINKYFQNINNSEQLLGTESKSLNQNQEPINYNIANKADLNIVQFGNYNYINVKSNSINQDIGQVGNYNNYEFLTYYGRSDLNFEVQQIGNNNYIQVLGENSLIDNMKIIQKSDFKTITITNY